MKEHSGVSTSSISYGYPDLKEVLVGPRFPFSKDEEPQGLICRGLEESMEILMRNPAATLADFLQRSSAGTNTSPPPGFQLLVRYVDGLCLLHGLGKVQPMAVYSSSVGGNLESSNVDLTLAEVVHMGQKSIVLRLPGKDSVIKVASRNTINQELNIHSLIDRLNCPNLRPLSSHGHGEVMGAGDGLSFLHLSHWCQTVQRSRGDDDMETYSKWWTEVRRYQPCPNMAISSYLRIKPLF